MFMQKTYFIYVRVTQIALPNTLLIQLIYMLNMAREHLFVLSTRRLGKNEYGTPGVAIFSKFVF